MVERRNQQSGQTQQSQGDQSGSRQQQQFDTGSGQQSGGTGNAGLTNQIRPHQDVVDQSGALVGTVDRVDGDRIKLTRDSSGDGAHRYIQLSQVAGIENNQIRLRDRGDASFGQQAGS